MKRAVIVPFALLLLTVAPVAFAGSLPVPPVTITFTMPAGLDPPHDVFFSGDNDTHTVSGQDLMDGLNLRTVTGEETFSLGDTYSQIDLVVPVKGDISVDSTTGTDFPETFAWGFNLIDPPATTTVTFTAGSQGTLLGALYGNGYVFGTLVLTNAPPGFADQSVTVTGRFNQTNGVPEPGIAATIGALLVVVCIPVLRRRRA